MHVTQNRKTAAAPLGQSKGNAGKETGEDHDGVGSGCGLRVGGQARDEHEGGGDSSSSHPCKPCDEAAEAADAAGKKRSMRLGMGAAFFPADGECAYRQHKEKSDIEADEELFREDGCRLARQEGDNGG